MPMGQFRAGKRVTSAKEYRSRPPIDIGLTMAPNSTDPPAPESPPQAESSTAGQVGDATFPVVGIGASAGGFEAFNQLLSHLPPRTGMAFVLVQHLDPKHASSLVDLLAKSATMPIRQVTDGTLVEVDRVYVIPPN